MIEKQEISIKVLLIGGRRSPDFPTDNREPNVTAAVFDQLIASARRQVQWLLRDVHGKIV